MWDWQHDLLEVKEEPMSRDYPSGRFVHIGHHGEGFGDHLLFGRGEATNALEGKLL